MTKKKDKVYIIDHQENKYEVLDEEIALKDISTDYDDYTFEELDHYLLKKAYPRHNYDWPGLKKSIEEEGLKTLPIITYNNAKGWKEDFKYSVLDGNHRIKVLKEIHGLKFKLTLPVVQAVLNVRIKFPQRTIALTMEDYLKIETIKEISGKRKQELMRKTKIKRDEG